VGHGRPIGSAVLVAFIAIYGAAQPEAYQRGLLALVPPNRRERAGAIMNERAVHQKRSG
jgi:hypothetical protein